MKTKTSRLNNLKLGFQRNELLYEAIMTDLYLMGALPKETVERYTGRTIPAYLKALEDTAPVEAAVDEVEGV